VELENVKWWRCEWWGVLNRALIEMLCFEHEVVRGFQVHIGRIEEGWVG
jgi:hypothetical protein